MGPRSRNRTVLATSTMRRRNSEPNLPVSSWQRNWGFRTIQQTTRRMSVPGSKLCAKTRMRSSGRRTRRQRPPILFYHWTWIKALREDKNEIFRAAHEASAGTDFVLSLDLEVSRAETLELAGSGAAGSLQSPERSRGQNRWPLTP